MPEIRIGGGVYIGLALGLLFLPLSWFAAAILAAVFHECCHLLAAKCWNVNCYILTVDLGGAVLQTQPMTRREELVISLAGPSGSLLLTVFLHHWPQLAVCGLVQGLFNLLPVYPLDGGRITYCLFGKWGRILESAGFVFVMLAGVLCSFRYQLGVMPVFLAVAASVKMIQRKFPCKAAKVGVQ